MVGDSAEDSERLDASGRRRRDSRSSAERVVK